MDADSLELIEQHSIEEINQLEKEKNEDKITSPSQLQDVTMDNSFTLGFRSTNSGTANQGGGNSSSGQGGRSLREYEEQMTSLKKENFNLKLRIYFLEEKNPGIHTADGTESFFKQTVDLKVEIEALRKELNEKQDLLCQAAKAMELMEESHKKSEGNNQLIIDELNQKIHYMEMEIEMFDKTSNEKSSFGDYFRRASEECGDELNTQQKITELEKVIKENSEKISELSRLEEISQIKIKELQNEAEVMTYKNYDLTAILEKKEKNEVSKLELEKSIQILSENKLLKSDVENLRRVNSEKSENFEKFRETISKQKRLLSELNMLVNVKSKHFEEYKTNQEFDLNLIKSQRDKLIKENEYLRNSKLEQNSKLINHSFVMTNRFQPKIVKLDKTSLDESYEESYLKDLPEKLLSIDEIEENENLIVSEKIPDILKKFSIDDCGNNETNNIVEDLQKQVRDKSTEHADACKTVKKLLLGMESLQRELKRLKENETNPELKTHQAKETDVDKCEANFENEILIERLKDMNEQLKLDLLKKSRIESCDEIKRQLEDAQNEAKQFKQGHKDCAELCSVLTLRLEELAGFLDSLLKHKDILGYLAADRRKAMRKAIDKSLDLSRSLNNMSLSLAGFSYNDTLPQISLFLENTLDAEEQEVAGLVKTFNSHEKFPKNQAKIIEDLKAEVTALKDELEKKDVRKERKCIPLQMDPQSESEAWSEPDRNVSLARIGLVDSFSKKNYNKSQSESTTDDELNNSINKTQTKEKISLLENLIRERDNKILETQCALVDSDNKIQLEKIKFAEKINEINDLKKKYEKIDEEILRAREELDEKCLEYDQMKIDRDNLLIQSKVLDGKFIELQKDAEELTARTVREIEFTKTNESIKFEKKLKEMQEKFDSELKSKDREIKDDISKNWVSRIVYEKQYEELYFIQNRLGDYEHKIEQLTETSEELKDHLTNYEKNTRILKKRLDDEILQSSKLVLERTKALNEKTVLEIEVKDIQTRLDQIVVEKSELYSKIEKYEKISRSLSMEETIRISSHVKERLENSSPDLGIESDAARSSGVESQRPIQKTTLDMTLSMTNLHSEMNAEGLSKHDCVKVDQENIELKRKLTKTKRLLEDTFKQLKYSNHRKEHIEREINQQILKTHSVLHNVRTNMENELKRGGNDVSLNKDS